MAPRLCGGQLAHRRSCINDMKWAQCLISNFSVLPIVWTWVLCLDGWGRRRRKFLKLLFVLKLLGGVRTKCVFNESKVGLCKWYWLPISWNSYSELFRREPLWYWTDHLCDHSKVGLLSLFAVTIYLTRVWKLISLTY